METYLKKKKKERIWEKKIPQYVSRKETKTKRVYICY